MYLVTYDNCKLTMCLQFSNGVRSGSHISRRSRRSREQQLIKNVQKVKEEQPNFRMYKYTKSFSQTVIRVFVISYFSP